jgi:hypothetical protein
MSSAPFVVPLPASVPVTTPVDTKKSKLAMKIKKAQEKHQPQAVPIPTKHPVPASIPPIFLPKQSRTRASPSAFASLLVDDPLPSQEHDAEAEERQMPKQHKVKDHQSAGRRSRRHPPPSKVPDFSAPSGFAFDGPSPDDVVFNARRETSLAQAKKPHPTLHATKPFISKT